MNSGFKFQKKTSFMSFIMPSLFVETQSNDPQTSLNQSTIYVHSNKESKSTFEIAFIFIDSRNVALQNHTQTVIALRSLTPKSINYLDALSTDELNEITKFWHISPYFNVPEEVQMMILTLKTYENDRYKHSKSNGKHFANNVLPTSNKHQNLNQQKVNVLLNKLYYQKNRSFAIKHFEDWYFESFGYKFKD